MKCPSNPNHGELVLRPIEGQTREQRWCGTWWDCPDRRRSSAPCYSGVLINSPELEAFLAAQQKPEKRS